MTYLDLPRGLKILAIGFVSCLSGSSGKSPDTRERRDPRPSPRPVPTTAAPEERVPMVVPVGRGFLDRTTDLLPRLEPTPLQCQTPQHLPPRLDQIQVGRVLGLEDELPPGKSQREQQHIHRPMSLQVTDDGVDALDLRWDPRLDPTQEIGPVGGAATGIGVGQRRAGRRAERPKDVPLAAAAVVDLLPRPPGGAAVALGFSPWLGRDGLLAGVALGRLWPHLGEADDDGALRRGRVEPVDDPLFSAKAGSTRSPNQVS